MPFYIYDSYKEKLQTYTKANFDPCRRGREIRFSIPASTPTTSSTAPSVTTSTLAFENSNPSAVKPSEEMESESVGKRGDSYEYLRTTIGQLNFFRWLIENRVFNFALEHIDKIEAHMLKEQAVAKAMEQKEREDLRQERVHAQDDHERGGNNVWTQGRQAGTTLATRRAPVTTRKKRRVKKHPPRRAVVVRSPKKFNLVAPTNAVVPNDAPDLPRLPPTPPKLSQTTVQSNERVSC
jgi:hypothetical protein